MTEAITLRDNQGQELGTVRTAARQEFTIYCISDFLRCMKINPSYATRVEGKMRAGKCLFATWINIRHYLSGLRYPTPEAIQFSCRRDPRIAPVSLNVQFKDNVLSRILEGMEDTDKILVLDHLDMLLTDRTMFHCKVGEENWKKVKDVDMNDVLGFPAAQAMEIYRGARKRTGEKLVAPAQQPFAIEVKDGKLCIQLEITGVQAQK